MKLSTNFYLSELIKSQEASRLGISNTPSPEQILKLKALCLEILEPVRAHFGAKPLVISSGFRNQKVNSAVGSSSTSQHTRGEAVDFEIPGVPNGDVAKYIRDNLKFDQLILEFYTQGQPNSGWVHVSYAPAFRKSVLTAIKRGSKTVYLSDINI